MKSFKAVDALNSECSYCKFIVLTQYVRHLIQNSYLQAYCTHIVCAPIDFVHVIYCTLWRRPKRFARLLITTYIPLFVLMPYVYTYYHIPYIPRFSFQNGSLSLHYPRRIAWCTNYLLCSYCMQSATLFVLTLQIKPKERSEDADLEHSCTPTTLARCNTFIITTFYEQYTSLTITLTYLLILWSIMIPLYRFNHYHVLRRTHNNMVILTNSDILELTY